MLKLMSNAAAASRAPAHRRPASPRRGRAPQELYSFEGPFGRFDQAQLQRGFKVYREVCSSCHSTNLVSSVTWPCATALLG
jgi:ubiquinol-cytochrome c reductase cytochrome c1 subunit